jgi:hypothetical protein
LIGCPCEQSIREWNFLREFTLPSGRRLQYERLSSGIYDVTAGETEPLAHTASATFKMVSDFRLIEQTDVIAARPGLTFGVSFMLSGGDACEEITMSWITRFPPGGVVTPDGDVFEMDRSACDVPIGKAAFLCYSFDHPWEMVPGVWHLELWHEDQLIADNAFTIILG